MVSFKKIDNFYVWGIKGILFLMPFIPLCVTPSLAFPYITGKNFAFRILVEIAAALWLGLISTNKEYRLRSSPIALSVLLFTFIVGLADIFGVNAYKSFWSNYERMEGYITILHLALYFLILKSVIRAKRDWKIIFNISAVVSVLVCFYAFIAPKYSPQLAMEYGDRLSGTIGNPPFLASYLLLSVFTCLILIVNTQNLYHKFVYLFPIIINSLTIYFSASRGAILAAFIGVMILSLIYILGRYGVSREIIIKKAGLSVIGILIALSVAFLTLRNTNLVKHDNTLSRFVNILSDASVQTRFSAWEMAWEGFKERPILGWGQENFISIYTVNPIPFAEDQIWVDRAHNIVIDWLVNAGIFGLFSYTAILGTAFYILWGAYQKKGVSKNEVLIIGTALTVYFLHNLFTFDTINTYLSFFTLLGYVDSFSYAVNSRDVKSENVIYLKGLKKKAVCAVLALLVFSGMFYSINYRAMKEANLFMRINAGLSSVDSFTSLLDDFNNTLSLQSFGDALVRQGMKDISFIIINRNFFTKEGALKFIEATVSELEKEIAASPYDLELLTDTIIYYLQIAKYEQSFHVRTEYHIRKCMQLNPEYERPYLLLTDLYLLKKDYELAYDNVQRIVDRDPQNDSKQLKLALAAIFASRDDVTLVALENVTKIRIANNVLTYNKKSYLSIDELYQLAQAYNDAKNFQKALEYYQEAINNILPAIDAGHLPPKAKLKREARIRFEMALVYLTVGDKAKALKEAQKAIELDPEKFAGVIDQIKSLNN